jgi:hypothetical protein
MVQGHNQFETFNGFPRETITLANWRTRPYSFWAFRNVGNGPLGPDQNRCSITLPAKVDSRDLLARPASPGASQPVADLLSPCSQADSFLVSRNGRLVCEWHARRRPQRSASGLLDLQVDHGAGRGHS